MKTIEPDKWGYSYDELIASFEVDVVLRVDDDDYQGDSRLLLRDGDRWGLLFFGWGSCSGCDALEAVGSDVVEATKLRDEMWNDVHWEASAAELLAYVDGKDWSLEWSWHAEETKRFLSQVRERLAAESGS